MSRASAQPGAPQLLLIDCGNSRLKWARCALPYRRGQPLTDAGAVDLQPRRRAERVLRALLRASAAGTRLQVCNVAGRGWERLIAGVARQTGLPAPDFVRTAAAAAGVRNGYAEPWRLGVDRWVALIGARHAYPRSALCIVAVGSAMTIDLLDANGRHRGGSIIPGPSMMIRALLLQTAGIRRRAQLSGPGAVQRAVAASAAVRAGPGLFGRDTRAALLGGATHAGAALIEHALAEARRVLRRRPRLLLGGGAAGAVSAVLALPRQRHDDLVLRGLAVLACAADRVES